MSSAAPQDKFFREMDTLRKHAKRVEPSELARMARQSGLTPHQALIQIQDYVSYGRLRIDEPHEALTVFLGSLCNPSRASSVLEYTALPYVLTARLAEINGHNRLTYISPYAHVVDTLRVIFQNTTATVVSSVKEVGENALFETIICSPPIVHLPPNEDTADGFGGEIVRRLVPLLSENGILYWVTGRSALSNPRAKKNRGALESEGLHRFATIEVAPGGFINTTLQGVVFALRRAPALRNFAGVLRDVETAKLMGSAFLVGPSRQNGSSWAWLDASDQRTFAELENARLIQKLVPRGRNERVSLGSLLLDGPIERVDRIVPGETEPANCLFVPEYAGSRVTADLDEQSVKPRAVYRLAVDPEKANVRFLARLLNGPYGKQLRAARASGMTIRRISLADLLALELPIPDMATQERIVRIDGDIGLLQATFEDMHDVLNRNWNGLSDVSEKIDGLKAVLDVERQIADWWRELPYPLATIYRRYQVSQNPKDRLDILLHFFELAAVYLAAVGASHTKALRKDWQQVLSKWLHPTGSDGIERTDFGFWIHLAAASLKDANRIFTEKELREAAIEIAGPELVQFAPVIGSLGKAIQALDVARRYRNSWKGHGGHIKPSDAARMVGELQQSVRDLYEITASVFRRLLLIRPGLADVGDSGFKYEVEKLAGSDPTFETELIELDRPAKSKSLAFWVQGTRSAVPALPIFRLGAPLQPQETSFYVFNRVETTGFRWISYQEAREQEFIAPDDELTVIIALSGNANIVPTGRA